MTANSFSSHDCGVTPMYFARWMAALPNDGPSFGNAAIQRAKYVGMTPQSWLENEFAVMAGGAVPSGNE